MFEFLRRLFGAKPRPDVTLERRVQALLSILHRAGLEPTAMELAETLWLAGHLTATPLPRETEARRPEKHEPDNAVKSSQQH